MIISKTPYRVSLFGGGSDYPAWYLENGGAVLGTAINKYCYINIRKLPPFFEHKHRIVYSSIELCSDLDGIQHPSVRAVLSEENIPWGMEVVHAGDLPARSGLGSSSSFTVGLLNAIRASKGRLTAPDELAAEAIRIEQDVIGESVGSQDQVWAAFGGTNIIRFNPDGRFHVQSLIIPPARYAELQDHMVLFFTGTTRFADRVAKKKIENLNQRKEHIKTMMGYVDDAHDILQSPSKPISAIGELLHNSWTLKRQLSDTVTNPDLDAFYERGRQHGAIGGKLLGAGGGGFFLFFVPPEKQQDLRQAFKDYICVDIKIGAQGSQIVNYEPNGFAERE